MNEYRAQIPHGGRWGLRARRLFDGEAFHAGAPLVVVSGDRISEVDLAGNGVSADLPIVDLGDVTLLPGLIDAHVHLAFDPAGDVVMQMQADPDGVLLQRMHRHAQAALRAGITTVRDLGDRSYLASVLRERYLAQAQAGPEILVAGPPITRTRRDRPAHCTGWKATYAIARRLHPKQRRRYLPPYRRTRHLTITGWRVVGCNPRARPTVPVSSIVARKIR